MLVETMPSLFDRIQPLNPRLVRKRKKHAMNVIDNDRWIVRRTSGNWNGADPGGFVARAITRGTLNVQPRAHTMRPAVAAIANPAVQSSMCFFVELVRITARKANEKPAISALMNAH